MTHSVRFVVALTICAWMIGLPAGVAAQPAYAVTDLGTLPAPPTSLWTAGTNVNAAGTVLALAHWGGQVPSINRTFIWQDGIKTEIGPLPGGANITTGVALNDAGEVAGYSHTCSAACGGHAFLWSNGTMFDLGTLGRQQSAASDLNNQGDVVGTVFGGAPRHAFLHSGGVTTDLGTLPGDHESVANAINASRRIVGGSFSPQPPSGPRQLHAVMWDDGAIVDLHDATWLMSIATDVNDAGQAIGLMAILEPLGYNTRGFRYSDGVMTDLGDFGGGISRAQDINEAGDVVGWASLPSPAREHAFLYTDGSLIDLGTLEGDDISIANAVNSTKQVVGYSGQRAFLYSDGTMVDLNALIPPGTGWQLGQAIDINDAGQIVGWGLIGGEAHAFRLDPLP